MLWYSRSNIFFVRRSPLNSGRFRLSRISSILTSSFNEIHEVYLLGLWVSVSCNLCDVSAGFFFFFEFTFSARCLRVCETRNDRMSFYHLANFRSNWIQRIRCWCTGFHLRFLWTLVCLCNRRVRWIDSTQFLTLDLEIYCLADPFLEIRALPQYADVL